jgi:hypothetical protein
MRQVIDEQVPVALAARPDLVSLVAGGNDLMSPGTDPDVLLATGVDTRQTPILRRARGKIAIFNAHIWFGGALDRAPPVRPVLR